MSTESSIEKTIEKKEIMNKIETVLNERVRSILRADGGDIETLSFDNGALKVTLLGACRTCPSANFEIEELVASVMAESVPQVRSVAVINSVSNELLDAARSLMGRNKDMKTE